MSNLEADAQQKTTATLLSAKNRKLKVQFARAHQNCTIDDWKMFTGLMNLDIQMVGSEFGVNNMKAWIHHALFQRFRLVVVVV